MISNHIKLANEVNIMIWPFSNTDTNLNQASITLNPFITTALSGLDREELRGKGRVRTLAECYVYGAIRSFEL